MKGKYQQSVQEIHMLTKFVDVGKLSLSKTLIGIMQ